MSKGSNSFHLEQLEAILKRFEASSCTHLEWSRDDVRIVLEKPAATTAPISPAPSDNSIVAAPFVGIFRACPHHTTEPFVQKGQWVKKGQVIGVIEAMKVLNEVVSPQEGKISDIHVSDKEPVAYNQPLLSLVVDAQNTHCE